MISLTESVKLFSQMVELKRELRERGSMKIVFLVELFFFVLFSVGKQQNCITANIWQTSADWLY